MVRVSPARSPSGDHFRTERMIVYISRLVLDHFRSWDHCVVDFDSGVNILQGFNGLGKTNIIEAVEVLSTGASHRASHSAALVERGQGKATIRANVHSAKAGAESMGERSDGEDRDEQDQGEVPEMDNRNPVTYEATIHAKGTNRARIDSGRSLYLRDIVGQVPSVMFAPEDQWLVSGDPAQRRTFLDQTGALLVPGYAEHLQRFTRIARQRAVLLHSLAQREPGDVDNVLSGLEIWTGQFIEAGVALTRDRRHIVDDLLHGFPDIYRSLAGERHSDETVGLAYRPSFEEVMDLDDPQAAISEHFQRIYPGEVARGRNLIGPHRDDMDLELDGMPAREFASNGEMWTLALALKMALLEQLAKEGRETPIVLLDDVFAQLDDSRRRMILDFARHQGQVLITVAAASDIPDIPGAHVIDVEGLRAPTDDINASLVERIHAMRMGDDHGSAVSETASAPTALSAPVSQPDASQSAKPDERRSDAGGDGE